jgi:hypothetical protein
MFPQKSSPIKTKLKLIDFSNLKTTWKCASNRISLYWFG